ncbi:helix-turn-helix transcriptional regulator [Micromonospora sp. NPDC049240]|uniref:helix-turn-helix domain-containing protein n=1 Tax=Micromonospora sp. NPDC049240 TaxID=3155151 RepID=UPI0033E4B2C4
MTKRRFSPSALRTRRTQLGVSQTQLAGALAVVPSAVCCWENGRKTPANHRLPDLASILFCSMDDLFEAVAE